MHLLILLLSTILLSCHGATNYYMGAEGDSCFHACYKLGKNCNAHIVTNNSIAIFQRLGVSCTPDATPWWAEDQPSVSVDPKDPNYGKCLGYVGVPDAVVCGGAYPAVRRLCACDDAADASSVAAFGTGLSAGAVTTTEQAIFSWVLNPQSKWGVMTHFWATAGRGILEGTLVRYYIDGETTASIQFLPDLACGTGFGDEHAPWATKWFGKGAADGSWFHNFKIPFQKSIFITVQHLVQDYGGFYMIVRGAPNLPIVIGDYPVPSHARMNLVHFQQNVAPLEWVNVASFTNGSGLFFMHTLAVSSNNLNFLEGCYHQYSPYNQEFPGTLLATGTEDYFDSGWYFNAGQFWAPVAGLTHISTSNGVQLSAYRFHEMDPLPFTNGFRFVWRNGDTTDPAGRKCYTNTGGRVVGNPGRSDVTTYAWVYTW